MSLQLLIVNNKMYFSDYLNDLITIYNEKIAARMIEEEYSREILAALSELIFNLEDLNQIKIYFTEISSPWMNELTVISNNLVNFQSNIEFSTKNEIPNEAKLVTVLQILKVIVSNSYSVITKTSEINLGKKTIITSIFHLLWPHFKTFLQSTSNDVVEITIQIMKYFMRLLKVEFYPYTNEFLQIIINAYSKLPFSSYLYCFEIVLSVVTIDITDLSNNNEEFNLLKSVLGELCKMTFELYLKNTIAFENNPQLTEDIFGLLFKAMKTNPLVVLDSNYFETTLITSINNIDLKRPGSALNVIYFLEKVFSFRSNSIVLKLNSQVSEFYFNKITTIIQKYGEILIYKIFKYLQSSPLEMLLEHLVNLSFNVINAFKKECLVWFINALKELPDNCLTNKEKDKMVDAINILTNEKSTNQDEYEDAQDKYNMYVDMIYNRSMALNYK